MYVCMYVHVQVCHCGSILNVCARKHTDLVACASSDVLLCDVVMMYMACFIHGVSAQVMMLVYGTWTTDMPRSQKVCRATGGLYIHMN